MRDAIKFFEDAIGFKKYDFPPSTVYSRIGMKKVLAEKIDEIDLQGAPPTLKVDNELIFISAEHRSELESFAKRNNIEIRARFDIWDAILEPFIDTEFTPEDAKQIQENLEKYGLGEETVQKWRERVKEAMIAYNFGTGLWDWVHLGQWDMLNAYKLGMGEKLTEEEYTQLYWNSMEIALLSYV
ncbi:MAG: hypothetical protein ACFFEV_00215 [Candidatus Thorarchaeota archaeon]